MRGNYVLTSGVDARLAPRFVFEAQRRNRLTQLASLAPPPTADQGRRNIEPQDFELAPPANPFPKGSRRLSQVKMAGEGGCRDKRGQLRCAERKVARAP